MGFLFLFGGVGALVLAIGMRKPEISYAPQANNGGETNTSAQITASPMQQIVMLAPKSAIAQGVKLTPDLFREIYVGRDMAPEGAVREFQSVEGYYARVDLPAGTPLVMANLQNTPLQQGIQKQLPEGYRAITLQVNTTSGVEGWATPGARVDVLMTYRDSNDGQYKTRLAVENATVISYNGSAVNMKAGAIDLNPVHYSDSATVTLAVPFESALKISTARAMGTLSLILRNTGDVTSTGEVQWSQDDFENKDKSKSQAKKRAFNSTSLPNGMVVYKDSAGKDRSLVLDGSNWYDDEE